MEYWQITALIGSVVFLFSAFLPFISVLTFAFLSNPYSYKSANLIDLYGVAGCAWEIPAIKWAPNAVEAQFEKIRFEWLLTMVLFPVALITGFMSPANRKLTLVAGLLGVICWIGSIWAIVELWSLVAQTPVFGQMPAALIQFGIGIFIGILGAIILLASYFIGAYEAKIKGEAQPRASAPPPPS